ncbi:hypothetical protein [Haloarcula sp. JP-L23]|uniref:hypothetical protein n=1 Tax=Haloarcula sp. JP-L23 TaxID=2716717 RepID=UPI00140F2B71|nr:hypothetical protein G9465_24550 [Haloarcula sp. JP-L23]
MHAHTTSTSGRAGRRWLTVLVAILALTSVAMPAAATATETTLTRLDTSGVVAQATNNTTANTSANTTSGPTTASQVRITPAIPDADYVSVTVVESDERFNTSGTFATFALSESVDAVRIEQPNAEARLLGDGSVVQVQYDQQAAPGDNPSLYTVELFFADGSTRTFDLLATHTDVTASPAINPAYETHIEYLETQAADMGYDADPKGVRAYVENREERAEFFEGLWTEQVKTFIGLRIAQAASPLDWVAGIAIIALVAYWLNRRHGWVLRIQQLAVSRAELVREAVRQEAERQRNAAAKHPLSEVDGIGNNAQRFWTKMGVETVENMIQVSCKGIVAADEHGGAKTDTDGNIILAHQGVDDLAAVEPLTERELRENTWLKPVILEGRLRASTALSHIEQALLVAEKDYNRGAEVRETRLQVQELIKDLQGRDDGTAEKHSRQGKLELPGDQHDRDPSGRPSGSPSGGDD